MIRWKIESLEYTNNSDKIVKRAHWRCTISQEIDGEYYLSDRYGSTAFDEITADASGFIAYSDLTEAKCLEWLYAKVDKAGIEAAVTTAVTEQAKPVMKTGKPW